MPDFLAIFDAPDHSTTTAAKSATPPASGVGLRWERWSWGWLGINPGLWRRIGHGENAILVCGRPAGRGGRIDVDDAITRALDGNPDAYRDMSGMFLVLHAGQTGLSLLTDRFSHRPAYTTTTHPRGDRFALSSNVEWIVDSLHTQLDFDDVSLAELLLWNNPTFPYTTRLGVEQLSPGSLHKVRTDESRIVLVQSAYLWQPREPDRWPSKRASIEACSTGIEESVAEISASASRIGVMLSGGADSRIIAESLAAKANVETFTYCDRPNPETDSAARTARTLGLTHHLVRRDPQFYAHAFVEGQRVLGYEQNSLPCHALCMVDHPVIAGLDVMVSGFGCDILLKGAYVPYSMTDVVLHHYRIRRKARQRRIGKHNYSHAASRKALIKPELAVEAFARREAYEQSLRDVRPETAEEWMGFYPISHTTSIDSTLISRYFPHDEFFFHAGIVEASMATPWIWKKGLDLVSALTKRFAPSVARLPHPDTGYAATMTYVPSRVLGKLQSRKPKVSLPPHGVEPWFSDGSFVNYSKFLTHAPAWNEIRDQAFNDPAAIEVLRRIIDPDPADTFRGYAPQYDSLLNATVVQILRLGGRKASGTPCG